MTARQNTPDCHTKQTEQTRQPDETDLTARPDCQTQQTSAISTDTQLPGSPLLVVCPMLEAEPVFCCSIIWSRTPTRTSMVSFVWNKRVVKIWKIAFSKPTFGQIHGGCMPHAMSSCRESMHVTATCSEHHDTDMCKFLHLPEVM